MEPAEPQPSEATGPALGDVVRAGRESTLAALVPVVLWVGVALCTIFLAVEIGQGRRSPWVFAELLAVCGVGVGLSRPGAARSHMLALCIGTTMVGGMGLLHFGPMAGTGLLMAFGSIVSTYFFGRRGALASVGFLGGLTMLSAVGVAFTGLDPAGRPADLLTWIRLAFSVTLPIASLSYLVYLIDGHTQAAVADALAARERLLVAEEERRRAVDAAMASQRLEAVGGLAAGVAHDVNNALTVIRSSLELLRTEVGSEGRRSLTHSAMAAVRTAVATTRQLLGFARGAPDETGVSDPVEVVLAFREGMARMLPEGVQLFTDTTAAPSVPLSAPVLEQVLLNLVVNARDAVGGVGCIDISVHGDAQDGVVIEVSDDGPGMEESTALRAFEPFFTTKGRQQGTGLGLAMVWGVVTKVGGRVELDTSPGSGVRVRLWLPACLARPRQREAVASAPRSARQCRVLLVEDQQEVLRVMQRVLATAGHTARSAGTVSEAIRALEEGPFDVLCTDGVLPDGTARDVIAAFRHRYPSGRVVLCTGQVDSPEVLHVVEDGQAALVHKPFGLRTLLAAIGGEPATNDSDGDSSTPRQA